MSAGGPVNDNPNEQEPLGELFGTVFDLADKVASRIGPAEVEAKLRRAVQEAGRSIGGELVANFRVDLGTGAIALMGMAAGASCALVAGRDLSTLDPHLERREAEHGAARAVVAEWARALHSVALRNARIGLLRGTLESGSIGNVELPAPLVLGQQTTADLLGWCAQTDALLIDVERETVRRSAWAILLRAADLAGSTNRGIGFGAPGDRSAAVAQKPIPAPSEIMRDDIIRMASRLSADASVGERESIARAAERVLIARSHIEATNRLADMRTRVEQANQAAAKRFLQAVKAAELLQPLEHADVSAQPLRTELLKVVTGKAPLTGVLRERARLAAADIQRAADRRYVRDSLTEALAELGYMADARFQTPVVQDGPMQVTRAEWNEHGVRMFIDDEKQELHALVVRTQADGGDADLVDVERESQWGAIQEQLRAELAAMSISYEVRSYTEPGARPVTVVLSAPSPNRPAQAQAARADQE